MSPTRRFLPLLSALVFASATVRAEDLTVAVMDFTAANASTSEAVAVSGFVRQALVRSGSYTVVDKKNMDRILQEQAFQQTGCTSSECAVKLGKLLNVRKMVVGEYTLLGNTRFLTASLVDVESGRIEQTGKVKGFDVGNADDAADRLVAQLEGKAGPSNMSGQQAQPQNDETPQNPGGQWKSPEQQAWEKSQASGAARKSDNKLYLMFYVGPTVTAGMSSYKRVSDYTWTSGAYTGDPTYEDDFGPIDLKGAGPAFGLRFGGLLDGFAADFEIDHASWTTPQQQTNLSFTYYLADYYGYLHKYVSNSTITLKDQLLNVSTTDIGFNIYGYFPNDVVQPYLGGGILFALMNTSSDYQVDVNDNPLNATTLGFTFQLPIGLRVFPSKNFFLWLEARPAISLMVIGYKTGPTGVESTDSYNIGRTTLNFGVGFVF